MTPPPDADSYQTRPAQPPCEAATPPHDLSWALLGEHGLRAGWAAFLFLALYYAFVPVIDTLLVTFVPSIAGSGFSPRRVVAGEVGPVLSMIAAALFIARIERRRLLDYNLIGPRPLLRLATGLLSGFAALSLLVGVQSLGGWLQFTSTALSSGAIVRYGIIWAVAFLLVGLSEEGRFRCFLQFILARGLNFLWALALVTAIIVAASLNENSHGLAGLYAIAALGIVPCAWIHHVRHPRSGFWQAAWATSVGFGALHTTNRGETAVGIFSAAFIGFVFCASIRVTGSAWWAIGCHAAWDWAETFFYGTADSGFPARSHLLTATPVGNPLLSGGSAGPEGSLLAAPVCLVLLAVLALAYRRSNALALATEHTSG